MAGRSAIVLAMLGCAGPAPAQVRLTTGRALELAFPKCEIQRRTVTLGAAQRKAIGKLCRQRFAKAMVFAYVARKKSKLVGTAWFDVHRVRSKKQLLMVVVAPDQTVRRVEVLAFAEPRRYAAPKRWLGKLRGKRLGETKPGHDVPRITGATMTVRATTRCVERILAVHRVVFGAPPRPAPDSKEHDGPATGTKRPGPERPASKPPAPERQTSERHASKRPASERQASERHAPETGTGP